MVVVCIGPVCIPLYGLVPILVVLLKPIWNRLPVSVQKSLRRLTQIQAKTTPLSGIFGGIKQILRLFFCAFSKKLKAIRKKLKAHFGEKTQPIGGYFRFYKKTQEISYPNYFHSFFINKFLIFRQKKCDFYVFLLHSQIFLGESLDFSK